MSPLLVATRITLRLLLALLFVAAGLLHLRQPALFQIVMPAYIPWPHFAILVSGVFELLGGLALLVPISWVQTVARWGLLALLVAVFPVNLQMALHPIPELHFPAWLLWARLPLQPMVMAAVYWVTTRR